MARVTLTHLYDTYDQATSAVQALEAQGVAHADVSIVSNDPGAHDIGATGGSMTGGSMAGTETEPVLTGDEPASAAGGGATLGTVVGGGVGLLAGIGALAIPGVGPVVAAGWLIATLTGAGAGAGVGGLLGSLVGHGVRHEDAEVYSEGVRRGGTLVAVQTDEANAPRLTQIMDSLGAVDVAGRREDYVSSGAQIDPTAPMYGRAEVEAERARVRGGNI